MEFPIAQKGHYYFMIYKNKYMLHYKEGLMFWPKFISNSFCLTDKGAYSNWEKKILHAKVELHHAELKNWYQP
jgi:hypothetical protein